MVHTRSKKGREICCIGSRLSNRFGWNRCKDTILQLSKRCGSGRIKVCKVTGNRKICARMASMGLYPGVEADIICSPNGAQCVLKVNGGTISLDSDISENIYVTDL